ncbi:hypothetical protein CesoFtcFv8_024515 [Champsocephalus esox]|uniref:Uncharacterized protein n=1 Tax=Champsocephalus esox TaxID=159716 RepID=A0AAN8GH69_9TELE|nr:hypothetical protein CesoFtcFv8_024515 [Champsocephalus esox]
MPRPTGSLRAIGTILRPRFPWKLSLQTRGQIWAHMVPIESANKRQTGAMTQCDPLFEGDRAEPGPLSRSPLAPLHLGASRGQLPAICLHLALHPGNKDPPWQPA